jgi:hypothetical protein
MSAPSLLTEQALAGNYPEFRFNQRERKLLQSVYNYVSASGSITLAQLSSGIAPSHVVKFAGNLTSLGGAATEAFAIAGLLSSDIVTLTMKTNAGNHEVRAYIPSANSLSIRFEADPGAGTVVSYEVLRAAT